MKHHTLIKILSYNVHKGRHPLTGRFVIDDLRNAIASVGADIVLLQEVQELESRRHRRSGGDLGTKLEFLADSLWPHFAYGKNAVYVGGHHGNAILSKFPFRTWSNIDISTNRLEKRGALYGEVELPDARGLHIISTHFNLLEASRDVQLKMLCRRLHELTKKPGPLLLCGDFNDWRGVATEPFFNELGVREVFLELFGSHARTFPSFFPFLTLDRIYFKGLNALEGRCLKGREWQGLSDHLALYAELNLDPQDG